MSNTLRQINGSILRQGNNLAVSDACCCDKCGECCWKITGGVGCPSPNVTVQHGSPPGVRIDFADSVECGGSCGGRQSIDLTTKYETTAPVTLTATGEGLVETQNAPFDILNVTVNGTQVLFLQAYNKSGGCQMQQRTGSGSIQLPAGCHTISITSGTNDALYHVGFYYKVSFSVSGGTPTDTCETSKLCNGYNCNETYGCQPATGSAGEYPTLAACEEICGKKERYYCNSNQGCRPTYDPTAPYDDLNDCETSGECIKKFNCQSSTGCQPVINAVAPYNTIEECQAACVEQWDCAYQGCASIYGTTGTGEYAALSACQAACFLTYTCQYYGCQEGGYSNDPTQNTQAECQEVCLERFTCLTYSACNSQGYATSGNTLAECEAICLVQSYECDSGAGCRPLYANNSGPYATLPGCEAVCLQRATCDLRSGCQYVGYGTSGNLYSNCAVDCVIQSYDCDTDNGCYARYNDATGAYSTSGACAAVCEARYQCQLAYYGSYAYCMYTGYATTGDTYATCSADCSIKSYDCTTNGCGPLIDTSGAYATSGDCSAVCVANYECIDYYGNGTYYFCEYTGYQIGGQSYEACVPNCPPPAMQMSPMQMQANPKPDIDTWLTNFSAQAGVTTDSGNTDQLHRYFVEPPPPPPRPPLPVLTLEEQDPTGPGTFLAKTLETIGIKSSPTCSCKARARHMNEMGNDWCAENLELLIGWLREEAQKRKLPFIDIAGRLIIKRAISLSRAAKRKNAQK